MVQLVLQLESGSGKKYSSYGYVLNALEDEAGFSRRRTHGSQGILLLLGMVMISRSLYELILSKITIK